MHSGIIGSETDGHEEWEVRKQPSGSFSEDYGRYCMKKKIGTFNLPELL